MAKDLLGKLQLFAEWDAQEQGVGSTEDPTVEDRGSDQGNQNDQESEQEPEKKYTDADVDKIISKKIAAERKRMSKLFNDEQQESELDKRERAVQKRELMADARDALTEQGLPTTLSALLDYTDNDSYTNSLKEVGQIFREAVQMEVKRTLSGRPPRVSTGSTESAMIANAFAPKSTR